MKITELLRREFVLEQLKAENKRDALAELVGVFSQAKMNVDSEAMLHVLLDRERLGSTGIGDGIAIPHGKLPELAEMVVSFGRSREGIAFDAMDGKPVHLFFLLMAPENSAGQHLKALARISRLFKDKFFRQALRDAKSPDDVLKIIQREDAY